MEFLIFTEEFACTHVLLDKRNIPSENIPLPVRYGHRAGATHLAGRTCYSDVSSFGRIFEIVGDILNIRPVARRTYRRFFSPFLSAQSGVVFRDQRIIYRGSPRICRHLLLLRRQPDSSSRAWFSRCTLALSVSVSRGFGWRNNCRLQ